MFYMHEIAQVANLLCNGKLFLQDYWTLCISCVSDR